MKNYTLHIFAYGETQINSDEFSIKVKTDVLTNVQTLIDAIWNLKPVDSESIQDFNVIHIFNDKDVRYMSKNKGFFLKDSQTSTLKTKIDNLIAELKNLHDNL